MFKLLVFGMTPYLLLFAVVLGVNLLPAFGPPTWSIIVFFGLNTELPIAALVVTGAIAAAIGRLMLAYGTRWLRRWTSQKTQRNLAAARAALEHDRRRGILALGVFALSPVPSAQLFEAAGLTGVRLIPFTLAFFAGRLVSYSIYAASAKAVRHVTLAETLQETLASPLGIIVQVLMLTALVALTKVNWAKVIARR